MPTIVRSGGGGTDVSAANATKGQVLSGATFYSNASDDIQTGTMNNHGAKQINVGDTGSAGYYSSVSVNASSLGNAKAEHVLSNATFTNTSKKTQSGSIVIRSDPKGTVGVGGTYKNTNAGYYSSITVTGPTLSGNAEASHVLSGKSFYSNTGTMINGSMTNHGALTGSVAVGGTYTNTNAGYYSSIKVTGPTLSGNATTSDVLINKTFYSTSGNQQKGTMTNHGAVSQAAPFTGGAGYYTSISITAPSVSLTGNASSIDVVYPYTFYNTSTTRRTGSFNYWYDQGYIITTSWSCKTLSFTPVYYGASINEDEDGDGTAGSGFGSYHKKTKCYVKGKVIYWCHAGTSKTHWGCVVAIGAVD